MKTRQIKKDVTWLGTIDWHRRIFDSLIPLPDGTSYNAYLVSGTEKTVLFDTVDPTMSDVLMAQLEDIPRIDFVVSHHAEQDHSGTIPRVLERFPEAKVICSSKAKGMLADLLKVPEDRFKVVEDGETLSLGGKTLTFIYTPWVHWPETMVTYLHEDKMLFTCDFFGSHVATSDLYVRDEGQVYEAAKRYFAEIMMPFRKHIQNNLRKLEAYDVEMIAPSHGPIYDRPQFILDAYRDWAGDAPKNQVVIPYVSMHGSTGRMIEYLVDALIESGISVQPFDLAEVDIGKLALSLVDAATIVVGTPTVLTGPHPSAAYAAFLANLLKPKARYLSVVGSFGWGGKVVEQLAGMIPNLKVEVIPPVLVKGVIQEETLQELDVLAASIAAKHEALIADANAVASPAA